MTTKRSYYKSKGTKKQFFSEAFRKFQIKVTQKSKPKYYMAKKTVLVRNWKARPGNFWMKGCVKFQQYSLIYVEAIQTVKKNSKLFK